MLDNTLTVDVVGTINHEVVFTRHSEEQNKSTYTQTSVQDATETFELVEIPAHSLVMRNLLQFYRSYNKVTKTSRGVTRTAYKLTRDVEVPSNDGEGTLVLPMIAEVKFSLPVGVTPDQSRDLRKKINGVLNDVCVAQLMDNLEV